LKNETAFVKKTGKKGVFSLGIAFLFVASFRSINKRSGREAKVIHKPVIVKSDLLCTHRKARE
jgi:hypothetical protein